MPRRGHPSEREAGISPGSSSRLQVSHHAIRGASANRIKPNGRDLGVPMWQRYVLLWVGREPAGPEGRKEKHP